MDQFFSSYLHYVFNHRNRYCVFFFLRRHEEVLASGEGLPRLAPPFALVATPLPPPEAPPPPPPPGGSSGSFRVFPSSASFILRSCSNKALSFSNANLSALRHANSFSGEIPIGFGSASFKALSLAGMCSVAAPGSPVSFTASYRLFALASFSTVFFRHDSPTTTGGFFDLIASANSVARKGVISSGRIFERRIKKALESFGFSFMSVFIACVSMDGNTKFCVTAMDVSRFITT
mmetsp:Transcript_24887/g.46510  ORF Transcript_24887/g.46510 Transcript_24887/m.46510 type:complete len:234 (-) Transcript_24887:602-1303(-)